jgi:hypothetical protein
MNGDQPPSEFSSFLSSSTPDEGPVSTRSIPRQRKRHKRSEVRKKRRAKRAS